MQTRIVDRLDGFRALRDAWEHLEAQAFTPKQQYMWAEACASTLLGHRDLCVIVLEAAGEPVAIYPLICPVDHRFLVGLGEELHEPCAPISRDKDGLTLLIKEASRLGKPLRLRRFPHENMFTSVSQPLFGSRSIGVRRPDNGSPWINLVGLSADRADAFFPDGRTALKTKQRRALAFGEPAYDMQSPTPSQVPTFLGELFTLEAASWKGLNQTALQMDPLRAGFYRHYAASAAARGLLRIHRLFIGGNLAAIQLAIEWKNRFWLLKIAYDPTFARCSPGNLLLNRSIRYGLSHGLSAIEFMGVSEPWKRRWTSLEHPSVYVRSYPLGLRGLATLAGDAMRSVQSRIERLKPRSAALKPVLAE